MRLELREPVLVVVRPPSMTRSDTRASSWGKRRGNLQIDNNGFAGVDLQGVAQPKATARKPTMADEGTGGQRSLRTIEDVFHLDIVIVKIINNEIQDRFAEFDGKMRRSSHRMSYRDGIMVQRLKTVAPASGHIQYSLALLPPDQQLHT